MPAALSILPNFLWIHIIFHIVLQSSSTWHMLEILFVLSVSLALSFLSIHYVITIADTYWALPKSKPCASLSLSFNPHVNFVNMYNYYLHFIDGKPERCGSTACFFCHCRVEWWPPKNICPYPNFWNLWMLPYFGKKVFVNIIKLRALRWGGYPSLYE